MTEFVYDEQEKAAGDEFLTPVYFNKEVLTRYLYDKRFHCDFASDTYGRVHGDGFAISFGINRHGSVIAWLGDLEELPETEQRYWSVENKASEHDMESEFFDAQILARFTEPALAIKSLNEIAKLNAAFNAKFGIHLYHERSIESRIADARRYKRLMIGGVDDFKRFISELNEIINENVDHSTVRTFLESKGITVDAKARGNKLLEAVYRDFLGDTANLIGPFFYLYDLRLWADHAMGDDKRDAIAALLAVQPADAYEDLMAALLHAVRRSVAGLTMRIADHA